MSQQTRQARSSSQARLELALLFAFALALRLAAVYLTPSADWAYSVSYKGDAGVWSDYARALLDDRAYELDLPLRPPANAYLMAAVWNGSAGNLGSVRLLWCVFGALLVVLLYRAIEPTFGRTAARIAGLLMASSNGLILLSTSLNNETPYLLIVALLLLLWPRLEPSPTAWTAVLWGAGNGLACLFRVEHLLWFAALSAWLLWRSLSLSTRLRNNPGTEPLPLQKIAGLMAVGFGVFLAVVAPWHLRAWQSIERFNTTTPTPTPAHAQLERALSAVPWSREALAQRELLPPDIRLVAANFITATVVSRGGKEVTSESFGILDEAFGSRPEPLRRFPFITLYGGLNFALANHPASTGGFTRALLNQPPQLAGGRNRFPALLLAGLPPPGLELTYPPHLDTLNNGYTIGLRWIFDHPGEFVQLVQRKLDRFLAGATLGFGSSNFPFGRSGTRWAVDLVVPTSRATVRVWQLLILLGVGWGLSRMARQAVSAPWLVWLIAQLVVTAAFFGYARFGAMTYPVFACALGVAIAPSLEQLTAQRLARSLLVCGFVVLIVDLSLFIRNQQVFIDGRAVVRTDPFLVDRHADRTIEFRRPNRSD